MAGFTDSNNQNLIRTNVWSRQLKELLLDDLNAMKFVRILSDFPDGYTINIPSIGAATQADFVEGQAVKYEAFDTGNYTFSFDQYKYTGAAISEKFKRDSFYAQDVIAAFVPRQHRVLMEGVETRIFAQANAGQTAGNKNVINNMDHRYVATGTSQALAFSDLAYAKESLFKANVPLVNLCAVVDPSVAYTIETQTNMVNLLTPVPMWGISLRKVFRLASSSVTTFSALTSMSATIFLRSHLRRLVPAQSRLVLLTCSSQPRLGTSAHGLVLSVRCQLCNPSSTWTCNRPSISRSPSTALSCIVLRTWLSSSLLQHQ